LIDQEVGKCQVALEQLRRCHVIPYPAMSSEWEDMQAVASGSGPRMEHRVSHPPPWGIMEGPYARHYARWLISDPAFDPNVVNALQNPYQAGKTGSERTTRGSGLEQSNVMASSRTHRGSSNPRLQALSHGYPEPREDKGPLILKRSIDGRMVKLVCTDCRRDNFNSAQGFINHCRIAHNRGYASHEAAALACGVEVEDQNSSNSAVESPAASTLRAALVHPLIRSPINPTPISRHISLSRRKNSTASPGDCGGTVGSSASAPETSSASRAGQFSGYVGHSASFPFIPSPQTPHLSAYFAKIGQGGNLNEMVDQAKTRVEIDAHLGDFSEDDEHDEELEDVSQTPSGPRNRSTRGVFGGAGLSRRPGTCPAPLERTPSNKSILGSRKPDPLPIIFPSTRYDSPYAPVPSHPPPQSHRNGIPLLDTPTTLNLSLNTIESHQAPSLISDDDGDEYENTHSESDGPSSAEGDGDGDRYLGFEVEDHGDEIDALEGSASADLGLATTVKPHAPGARRTSALRSPTALRAGPSALDRHVSFANPGRRSRENLPKSQRRKGGK
jgi:ADA HAT complex component 1